MTITRRTRFTTHRLGHRWLALLPPLLAVLAACGPGRGPGY